MPALTPRGAVLLAIAAAVVTIGMKAAAYAVTGSAGLLSDALESGVNLVAAGTAYFSVWYAARPEDESHTYGHEKIEFFASGFEGALVFVAGGGTIAIAAARLANPGRLEQLDLGIGIAGAAAMVNLVVARVLLRVGRRSGSVVLEADGKHLMTDVYTTIGVVAGLGLVAATGVWWLDPVVAAGVGVMILNTGYQLTRQAFHGLMDRALPPPEQARLRELIRTALPPGTAFHALRTRRAGRRTFAEFHLLVPGSLTVTAAHAVAHDVEEAVRAGMPGITLTTHVEPIDDPSSWEAVELARLGEPTGPAGVANEL